MVAAANLCAGVFSGDQSLNINGNDKKKDFKKKKKKKKTKIMHGVSPPSKNTGWKRKQPKNKKNKKQKKKKSSRVFKFKGPPIKQTSLTTNSSQPQNCRELYTKLFFQILQFYGRCVRNYSAKLLFHSSQTDQVFVIWSLNFILLQSCSSKENLQTSLSFSLYLSFPPPSPPLPPLRPVAEVGD